MNKLTQVLIILLLFILLSTTITSSYNKVNNTTQNKKVTIPHPKPNKSIKKPLLKPSIKNQSKTNPLHPLVLVNKEKSLTDNFVPPDLVVPDIPFTFEENLPKKKIRKTAAEALEKLFAQAKKDNINLIGVSGYRSYQRQKTIFNHKAQKQSVEAANQTSAKPGESEHQTGLAMDVSSPSVNYQLIKEFGATKEGKWLAQNAYQYGFIIRYPKNKTQITGYQYEPWHLRYIGPQHAQRVAKRNLTLEEYLQLNN